MSESSNPKGAKSPEGSKSKESSGAKSEGGTGSGAGAEVKPKEPSESKSEAGSKASGKSARESVGGSGEVHYGYFSNVKTPAYRSGWDNIWNDKNEAKKASSNKRAPARKKPGPITVTFDIDEIPANLKEGLVALARAELKRRRVNYDRRDQTGSVNWRIECRIQR
jgi:hypothetical protein